MLRERNIKEGGKHMYIETRFYDNGKAEARLHMGFGYPQLEEVESCDRYVESIGESKVQTDHDNSSDYESLEEWVGDLKIELDDIAPLVLGLEAGKAVDISNYV
jgi:hypothetical protein